MGSIMTPPKKKSRNMGQLGSQMLAVDHSWQSVDAILEDVPVIDTFLMLNYQFKDYNLSVFQKWR